MGEQAGEPEAEKQSEAKKAADGGGDDDEEEGEAVDVPFSRLLPLNRPEWGLGVLGLAACIVQGVRHGAAGIITAFFLASLYTTPQVRLVRRAFVCTVRHIAVACTSPGRAVVPCPAPRRTS